MWYAMSNLQQSHDLSERLIRAISDWRTLTGFDDDIEQLLEDGADINRLHGTLLPLHCACMVADSYCLQLLLQKGAEVTHSPCLLRSHSQLINYVVWHESVNSKVIH